MATATKKQTRPRKAAAPASLKGIEAKRARAMQRVERLMDAVKQISTIAAGIPEGDRCQLRRLVEQVVNGDEDYDDD